MQMNISESTSQVVAEAEISLSASDVKDKYRVGTLSVYMVYVLYSCVNFILFFASLQFWHMYLFSNHYVCGC